MEAALFNRHFDPFNLLIDRESRTIFVLNPKVMTSLTRKVVRRYYREFRPDDDASGGLYPWLKRSRRFPLFSPLTYLRLAFDSSDFASYSVVRNPYARTLSAWRDKFLKPHTKGGGGDDSYPRSMRAGELQDFRRFARRHGLPGGEAGTLVPMRTFLLRIADQPEGRRNHHWDTQRSVIQAQHFSFARVFRHETEVRECLVTVFGRMGIEPAWVEKHIDTRVNTASAHHYRYTPEEAELARSIFAADCAAFGYATEVPAELVEEPPDRRHVVR